jgi:hypothetical protein
MTGRTSFAAAAAAVVVGAFAAAAAGEPPAPGQMPYEAGAGNLGVCSPFLASLGVRDDINRLIQENPGLFDRAEHPGELYSVRAKQRENLPPPLECLARS